MLADECQRWASDVCYVGAWLVRCGTRSARSLGVGGGVDAAVVLCNAAHVDACSINATAPTKSLCLSIVHLTFLHELL